MLVRESRPHLPSLVGVRNPPLAAAAGVSQRLWSMKADSDLVLLFSESAGAANFSRSVLASVEVIAAITTSPSGRATRAAPIETRFA
ncbi:hypothetical protein MRX96_021123 [Rhipicephalus microplus]